MGWMRYTCRQAAGLISLQRDEPLGFWRATALKLHLQACGDCRQIEHQLDRLGAMSSTLWHSAAENNDNERDQR
jgi:Putative zinc-finger